MRTADLCKIFRIIPLKDLIFEKLIFTTQIEIYPLLAIVEYVWPAGGLSDRTFPCVF
jgi:hypothetical protein